MRLSELLGAEVVDEHGRSAGRVHDVRLEQDGPMIGTFGASLRLAGLIVGRRALAARFGSSEFFSVRSHLRNGSPASWSRGNSILARSPPSMSS